MSGNKSKVPLREGYQGRPGTKIIQNGYQPKGNKPTPTPPKGGSAVSQKK